MIDLLFETWRSIQAHAFRFLLTSLGIAWGAFMLTFLSANMAGTDAHITRELEELGEKTVFMGGGVILKNRVGERASRAVELEDDDLSRIDSVAAVERVTPNMQLWSQIVRASGRTKVLHVLGNGKLLVGGVNLVKKHERADPNAGQQGGIIEKEAPIQGSNIAIWNDEAEQADKVGIRSEDGKKVRFYKSNDKVID